MGPLKDIKDDVLGRARIALLALPTDADLPGPIVVVYTDPDSDEQPDQHPGAVPWARVTLQSQFARFSSISGRRRRMEGQLTIQLFLAQDTTSATDRIGNGGDVLADLLVNSSGDTELYDIRSVWRQPEGGWARCDVIADFWAIVVGKRPAAPFFSTPPGSGGGGSSSSQYIVYNDVLEPVTGDNGDPLIGT